MSTDKNLKRIPITVLVIFVSLVFAQKAKAVLYEDVAAFDLQQRITDNSDNGYIILDIRESAEYEQGHIPGAINIPLKELGYTLYKLDRIKDIIAYCNFGLQSKIACQVLANAGFKDVYNLTDGLRAWDYALQTSYGSVAI